MLPNYFTYRGDQVVPVANRALVFLQWGQSNCGDSELIANAQGYLTGGAVAGVYIADRLKTGFAPYEIGVNNNVYTSHTTFGPTGELGYRLNAALSEDIYILKLGVGGSAINSSLVTGVENWNYNTVDELHAEFVDMITWAKTQSFGGKTPYFAGMMINQGEADASGGTQNYPEIWYQVVNGFRAAAGRMDMPVAIMGLSPSQYSGTKVYTDMQALAANDTSIYYLDSTGYTYKPDNVHLNAAGIAACGLAAANVFLNTI